MKTKEYLELSDEQKNAMVAEAMGWEYLENTWKAWSSPNASGFRSTAPDYYHDMNLCMESIKNSGCVSFGMGNGIDGEWIVRIYMDEHREVLFTSGELDTPQEAIMIAVLKAKGKLED